MTRDSHSRRDYLRALGTTGAAIGGSALALPTASADDRTTGDDPDAGTGGDRAAVRLVPTCVDRRRDAAVFRAVNDGSDPVALEWRTVPTEDAIEFVDCRTVRVTGAFADVLVDARFVAEDGEIGNVIEPVGAVDGERTITVDELDGVPDEAVVATAEAFAEGPAVPGTGVATASNPDYDRCREEFLDGDGDGSDDPAPEESLEFLDCQRLRAVGEFADVAVDATFVAEDGHIGNVIEFFGPVDGERVIDVTDGESVPEDAIAVRADAFAAETPRLPYEGDVSASRDDYEACQEEIFGEVVDGPSDSSADGNAAAETRTASSVEIDGATVETAGDDRNALSVPAGGERRFAVDAPDGRVTVELLADGERVDAATSATESACRFPIVPWLFNAVTSGRYR